MNIIAPPPSQLPIITIKTNANILQQQNPEIPAHQSSQVSTIKSKSILLYYLQ